VVKNTNNRKKPHLTNNLIRAVSMRVFGASVRRRDEGVRPEAILNSDKLDPRQLTCGRNSRAAAVRRKHYAKRFEIVGVVGKSLD
jgi:hypothetical protein